MTFKLGERAFVLVVGCLVCALNSRFLHNRTVIRSLRGIVKKELPCYEL